MMKIRVKNGSRDLLVTPLGYLMNQKPDHKIENDKECGKNK